MEEIKEKNKESFVKKILKEISQKTKEGIRDVTAEALATGEKGCRRRGGGRQRQMMQE